MREIMFESNFSKGIYDMIFKLAGLFCESSWYSSERPNKPTASSYVKKIIKHLF
jgi:hypothetical protein